MTKRRAGSRRLSEDLAEVLIESLAEGELSERAAVLARIAFRLAVKKRGIKDPDLLEEMEGRYYIWLAGNWTALSSRDNPLTSCFNAVRAIYSSIQRGRARAQRWDDALECHTERLLKQDLPARPKRGQTPEE